jgi:hypothetical protein
MNARIAIAAFLCATSALADVPQVPGELPPAPISPYLLAGPRFLETNIVAASVIDTNARTDAPADARTGRSSAVIGGEIGYPLADQRVRPSAFTGIQLGYWGDDKHGPFSFYLGARLRVSFWMGDLWDFYVIARGDFPVTPDVGAAVRPGLGLGMRLGRAVSLEATYDVLAPLGGKFESTEHPNLVPFGMTIALAVDPCFSCNRSAKPQLNRNVACRLYNFAKQDASCEVRAAICAAVPKALESCPDPLQAKRDDDGTSTFLAALADGVGTQAKPAVNRLLELHHKLLAQWVDYEKSAAAAGVAGRELSERWSYAPVPSELREYLGCDGGPPPPDCEEVTK